MPLPPVKHLHKNVWVVGSVFTYLELRRSLPSDVNKGPLEV